MPATSSMHAAAVPGTWRMCTFSQAASNASALENIITAGAYSQGRALHEQVAGGAAGAVVDQLSSIARLTPAGSQQLAADLEYLCNVLSALGVDIPQALAVWQVCKQCSLHAAAS